MLSDFVEVRPPRNRKNGLTRLVFASDGQPTLGGLRGKEPFLLLTPKEIEKLIEQLQDAITEPEFFVEVQVQGNGPAFTYRDPSGELEVGDRVIVPFGYQNTERLGRVVRLGKGDVPSHITIKDAYARLEVEELSA